MAKGKFVFKKIEGTYVYTQMYRVRAASFQDLKYEQLKESIEVICDIIEFFLALLGLLHCCLVVLSLYSSYQESMVVFQCLCLHILNLDSQFK